MKTSQIYFNVVLTIIAFCLVGILVQNQILLERQGNGVQAVPQNAIQPTQFQPVKYPEGAKFILVPMNSNGAIDVNIKGLQEMDVNLRRISTSDILNINLERLYGSPSGKLQVEQR